MSDIPATPQRPPDAHETSPLPAHRSVPTGAPMDREGSGLGEELAHEVAAAMAEMDAADLAELSGGFSAAGSRTLEKGAEVTGTVVGVRGDDVFLDLGQKDQGVVPRSHFGRNEDLSVGRRVDVLIERRDDANGLIICNRKGAIQRATWINMERGMIVEGRVTGLNKGGLEVDLKGIRAFLPASQVDVHFMKDISTLIGQTVTCEVTEVDRRNRNVLLSRRRVLERELAEKKQQLLAQLEVGQVRKGIVRNIAEFGAFVDIGGVEGLIHISDLSWRPVAKVTDIVQTGQEVEVRILKIDMEKDRISLGLKQALPDPWTGAADRYVEGQSTRARVVRIVDFGAFAELEEGIEGLIPISEMSWGRVHAPSQVVSVGDEVDVRIIRVDVAKRRIGLSMKQAQPDPWAGVVEGFVKGSLVKGTVTRLETFGVFVSLVPGVEGMIHISELSDKRVKTCADVVAVGQEVEARVLEVDVAKRRIALSLKAAATPSAAHAPEADGATHATGSPKGRKKRPVRGGLSTDWDWLGGGLGK